MFAPPATREAALDRLDAFMPNAGRAYAARRNRDSGPGARVNVSQLSPALRRRLVTEAEVARAAADRHGAAAEKFVSEVAWRTYFRGWLELRPAIWRRYQADLERDTARLGAEGGLAKTYARAIAGATGIDAFDSWAIELTETGYLHNHSRMNFASIWTFTLGLPWTLGAAHFHRHLLDGCPASNTLGWRWVVGLQTAGKAYRANPATIREMSGGRHAVASPLAQSVVALSEPPVPGPGRPPAPPLPGAGRAGLLIHAEDVSPELHDVGDAEVVAIAAFDVGEEEASPARAACVHAALTDGLARAGTHFGAPGVRLGEMDALVAWARDNGVARVVTPYAPVGPIADWLAAAGRALAPHGIALAPMLADWDRAAFPHAGRGFFHFRERIPELIAGK